MSTPPVTTAAKEPKGLVGKLLIKRFKPTNNSNSTGLERHLKNLHRTEWESFSQERQDEEKKVNNINSKKRPSEVEDNLGPKLKQAKFAFKIVDKELQKRWDDAMVDYCADSFVFLSSAE